MTADRATTKVTAEMRRELHRPAEFGGRQYRQSGTTARSCDRCGPLTGSYVAAEDHAFDNPGHVITATRTESISYSWPRGGEQP